MKVSPTIVNTIIVGGGHAGVNLACMLELQKQNPADGESLYFILEREDSLLSKWRNKRWDHFQLNTPVGFSGLHGQKDHVSQDPWFLDRPLQQDLDSWDAHIERLNIRERCRFGSNVISVEPLPDGGFETIVEGQLEGDTMKTCTSIYRSKNVVVCNGMNDHNVVPSDIFEALPAEVKQHTSAGFHLEDLIPGNILVVGSSQSGIQISNILLDHLSNDEHEHEQTQLYLACSAAGGCPRSFRGHDLFYWLHRMKFLYISREALAEMPAEKGEALRYGGSGSPVTGPNKAISPFSVERKGAVLVGRLKEVRHHVSGGIRLTPPRTSIRYSIPIQEGF